MQCSLCWFLRNGKQDFKNNAEIVMSVSYVRDPDGSGDFLLRCVQTILFLFTTRTLYEIETGIFMASSCSFKSDLAILYECNLRETLVKSLFKAAAHSLTCRS